MKQFMIDKYLVIKELGRGGMGCVYQVKDIHLNKLWAMKIVPLDAKFKRKSESIQLYVERLKIEANLLKDLNHPLLPMIVDLIHLKEGMAIIMEFIEGITLERYIDDRGMVSQEQAVTWGIQIAEVLLYLHSRKPALVYGDLKPSNIMVRYDGSIKVIDFGAARKERDGNQDRMMRLGTYGYVAPELIPKPMEVYENKVYNEIDPRSDIFSLGATLYHMVTGVSPAKAPYGVRPIRDLNSTLSEGLEKIILKCTNKSLFQRYQNCSECIQDLKQYKKLEKKYVLIKKILSILYGSVVLTAIILLVFGLMQSSQEFEKEAVINALTSVILAIIAFIVRRIHVQYRKKKSFCVRQIRNVIRTEKKVMGLWCMTIMVVMRTFSS